ncbi:lysine biosynthesis protein LysW [Patescibacteria group bacterium]|nr:lysine biosynthesis protein LysW [Patescibacteria group bacterium]
MDDSSDKGISAKCPECDTPLIIIQDTKAGHVVECPACGTESEIVSLEPLQLSPLEEEK